MSPEAVVALMLAEKHPREFARLVHASVGDEFAELLSELSSKAAANVLRFATPRMAALALFGHPPQKLEPLVTALGLQETAALIGYGSEEERSRFFEAVSKHQAEQLRRLTNYGPRTAGKLMTPEVASTQENATAAEVLSAIRAEPTQAHYYVYVVGESHKLIGVVTIRELMCAPESALVGTLMTKNPTRLRVGDPAELVLVHSGWHSVHAMPVVDDGDRLLGIIRYSRFRDLERHMGEVIGAADPARTSSALAELYAVGAGALLRWAGAVLTETDAEVPRA